MPSLCSRPSPGLENRLDVPFSGVLSQNVTELCVSFSQFSGISQNKGYPLQRFCKIMGPVLKKVLYLGITGKVSQYSELWS